MQTHICLHYLGVRIVLSELQEGFWILRVWQAIKESLSTCFPCKIARKPSGQEWVAPMPADRVTASQIFHVTGIDITGPLYVKRTPLLNSCYIALFTCATIHSVRLEICSDVTTDKFFLAFHGFIVHRRLPHTMYTDNALTYIESLLRRGDPVGLQDPSLHGPIGGNSSHPGRLGGTHGGKGW
jgi:hypothetical protein